MPLLLVAIAVLGQAQTPVPSFPQTVLQNFSAWDSDGNGQLTQAEIDARAVDPTVHGTGAAALAALHAWLIVAPEPHPVLNRAWFESYRQTPFRIQRGTAPGITRATRKEYSATPGSLQRSFVMSCRRLSRATDKVLFDADGPSLDDIRQGGLGDCFMLAPVGALVHRNADDIRKMIQMDGDGYTVRFGDGQTVHIGQLTDAELAMGGSSTKSGYWIRIIEKAYGSRKISNGETAVATDSMHGGSSGAAGRAFTGHKFASLALIGDYKKEVSADTIDAKLRRLREDVPKAIADHRLVLAGTSKHDMPKSISPNHAYAIFDYDAKSDRITLWNPHGNDFTPKGKEGPEFGYKIEDGVFSMPLEMFVRTFSRAFFEGES